MIIESALTAVSCLDCGVNIEWRMGRPPLRCPACRQARDSEARTSRRRASGVRARGTSDCGTVGGFQRHRRAGEQPCEPCRAGKRSYDRENYRKLRGTEPPLHGVSSGYRLHGCLCDRCHEAAMADRRAYHARHPEKNAEMLRRRNAERRAALALVRKLETEGVI